MKRVITDIVSNNNYIFSDEPHLIKDYNLLTDSGSFILMNDIYTILNTAVRYSPESSDIVEISQDEKKVL